MLVGIDMRMSGEGFGIGTYINELVKALLKRKSGINYRLFFDAGFSYDGYKSFASLNADCRLLTAPYYSAAEQLKLPLALSKEKLDLMHFPNFNVPILYPGKFVLTLHDLIHHKFPGKKKRNLLYRWGYKSVIKIAAIRAERIIAVSRQTKSDIGNFLRVPESKVDVVYEGVKGIFGQPGQQLDADRTLAKYGIRKPYLLTVGVWRKYKNLPALAQAFDVLKTRLKFPHQLVLAGEIDPNYPEIKNQVMSVSAKDSIVATGKVSDPELKNLYASTELYISPSLSEGFGLTALEAQACGAPVLCSDIAVAREVLKDSVIFFNPENQKEFVRIFEETLSDKPRLFELKKKSLDNSRNFSWEKAARETEKIYLKVIE